MFVAYVEGEVGVKGVGKGVLVSIMSSWRECLDAYYNGLELLLLTWSC
jgi:hypothetical protein